MSYKKRKPIRPVPIPDGLDEYLDVHQCGSYFSRGKELAQLMAAHRSGMNPLMICGKSSCGKTILAKELAWNMTKQIEHGKRDRSVDKTFTLKFEGSIRETISRHHIPLYVLLPIGGWGTSDEDIAAQRYVDKLSLLKQAPVGSVFILDGVNSVSLTALCEEPEYDDLLSLGTVVITSNDTRSFPEWVIDPLPDEYKSPPCLDFDALTREERIIVQNAALLPPTGMPMTTFLLAQGMAQKETALKLIREGSLNEVAHQGILPSPLGYSGSDDDYKPFLTYIRRRAEHPHTSQKLYEVFCQVLKRASYFLADEDGLFAQSAGRLFKARGDYTEAIPLQELFLLKQRKLRPQNPITLAQALYNVGCIRGFQAITRKYTNCKALVEEGKAMLLQALELQEANLNRGHIDLARTRLALAQIGVEFSDYAEAENLANFALKEQLSEFPEDHHEIAETLLGCASLHIGAFSARIARKSYVERAVTIVDKWNFHDIIQADTYSMMEGCLTYSDIDKRIELLLRSLDIRERWIPHERHTLYSEHHHMAWLANRNHNYQLEVAELSAAIEILREMLPPEHPKIQGHLKELEAAKLRAESGAN